MKRFGEEKGMKTTRRQMKKKIWTKDGEEEKGGCPFAEEKKKR